MYYVPTCPDLVLVYHFVYFYTINEVFSLNLELNNILIIGFVTQFPAYILVLKWTKPHIMKFGVLFVYEIQLIVKESTLTVLWRYTVVQSARFTGRATLDLFFLLLIDTIKLHCRDKL